jgi:hypothetical protein
MLLYQRATRQHSNVLRAAAIDDRAHQGARPAFPRASAGEVVYHRGCRQDVTKPSQRWCSASKAITRRNSHESTRVPAILCGRHGVELRSRDRGGAARFVRHATRVMRGRNDDGRTRSIYYLTHTDHQLSGGPVVSYRMIGSAPHTLHFNQHTNAFKISQSMEGLAADCANKNLDWLLANRRGLYFLSSRPLAIGR